MSHAISDRTILHLHTYILVKENYSGFFGVFCRTSYSAHNTGWVLLNKRHTGNKSSGANQSCNHTSVCSPQGFGCVMAYFNDHPLHSTPSEKVHNVIKVGNQFKKSKICLLLRISNTCQRYIELKMTFALIYLTV